MLASAHIKIVSPDTTPDVTNTGYYIYEKPNGSGSGGKSIFQPIGSGARATRYINIYTIAVYISLYVSGGNKSCIYTRIANLIYI